MLQHDIEVVEQPIASRAYVDIAARRIVQPVMNYVQYLACIVEPAEKRTVAVLFLRWKNTVPACDVPGMLPQAVGTKRLSPDGTDKRPVIAVARTPKETKKSV
ncbi:MAG: hypothetical protein H0T48_15935 [Gemmatimonadaceae bacterium]|nr:hypothetical protein [Gemmatimonadaceae bacterium]